jgi:hypothetical protein
VSIFDGDGNRIDLPATLEPGTYWVEVRSSGPPPSPREWDDQQRHIEMHADLLKWIKDNPPAPRRRWWRRLIR